MNRHPLATGFGNSHPPRFPFLGKGDAVKALCAALVLVAATAIAAVGPNVLAVPQDQLSSYWVMDNTSLYADAPNQGVNLDKPACSAVTYMIGSDGVTRDIMVRKTVPAGGLGKVAASTVKNMHYAPGANNPGSEPVFTYIIIGFNLPDNPAESKKIRAACTLQGFPHGYR